MDFKVTKEIDKLGRIVIPAFLRKYYGIALGDKLQFVPLENGILIKPEKEENSEK